MVEVVLAPHLDDEIIGCHSVFSRIDTVIYFDKDLVRLDHLSKATDYRLPEYVWQHDSRAAEVLSAMTPDDVLYLPSRFDYHPLHHTVRSIGLNWTEPKKMFYSVEMNVPWLEIEEDPEEKLRRFKELYPSQVETITKNDKYFLFQSIKPFDEVIWATVRFERVLKHCYPLAPESVRYLAALHRHKFYFEVSVQQYGDDRDVEYLLFSQEVQDWFDVQRLQLSSSCEMMAAKIKRYVESRYIGRLVRVSVFEDNENGCTLDPGI